MMISGRRLIIKLSRFLCGSTSSAFHLVQRLLAALDQRLILPRPLLFPRVSCSLQGANSLRLAADDQMVGPASLALANERRGADDAVFANRCAVDNHRSSPARCGR